VEDSLSWKFKAIENIAIYDIGNENVNVICPIVKDITAITRSESPRGFKTEALHFIS